jgi:hypothetical protein
VVSGQGPVAVSSGIVCQAVAVTQRALQVAGGGTEEREQDATREI